MGRPKSGKVVACQACGMDIYVRDGDLKTQKTFTCSKKCMGEIKQGIKRSAEVGLHISQTKRGKPLTEDHKKKLREAPRKLPTIEAIAKRTDALRKHYQDPEVLAMLPDSRIKYTCEQCGNDFFRYRNGTKRGQNKYCSVKCRGIANQTRVVRVCPSCGKNYTTTPSKIAAGNRRCSRTCSTASHQILKPCEYCGKMFKSRYFMINSSSRKYCSRRCYGKAESGPNSSLYIHGKWKAPYCPKFDEKLKEEIRDAFGRKCYLCPKIESENGNKLDVHHCDYNKGQGCGQRWNLLPLCIGCHARTTHKRKRHYYFNLLSNYWAMNPDINFRGSDAWYIHHPSG
jgi:hypothetical protein